jgi:hypothetical protein
MRAEPAPKTLWLNFRIEGWAKSREVAISNEEAVFGRRLNHIYLSIKQIIFI